MSEWHSVKHQLPMDLDDGESFYTFENGVVREDCWYSAYSRTNDGWGDPCLGKCFYAPNSSPEYDGEFKAENTTHWMRKPELPDPPL